jgi:uncharacterized membrane protein YccC
MIPAKAKEPFKTALAMVISYGIALAMDWDNPFWAGFAVAFVSLSSIGQSFSSIGQSFNKGAMRMLGTFVGCAAALVLIGLFPQERWLFMVALSTYVGLCTYLMTGPKYQYFWNVSGFVCILICMSGGPNPVNAFETAVLRAEETGLGILVYSLVAILLWPVSSRKNFFATTIELVTGQRQLCQATHSCFKEGSTEKFATLKGQVLQTHPRFQQLIDAAESDTYEIREMRQHWQRFQKQATELTQTIDLCSQSIVEIQSAQIIAPMRNSQDDFFAEMDKRFAAIERMLNGQSPDHAPCKIELDQDLSGLSVLSHFERASVVVFRTRLQQLDQLSLSQFETISTINGFAQDHSTSTTRSVPNGLHWPDPDRMLAVVRVMLTMWLAYLALIYIDSIPGGNTFVTMAGVFSMIMASTPQLSLMMLFIPLAASVLFGCLVYLLLLPHLTTFLGLGLLLFIVTFAFCYLFAAPKQQLVKIFGIAMFIAIASIDNQQSYSFMVVATNVLMYPLLFMLLAVTAHFPVILSNEKSFLRLLGRYFCSCDYILSNMHEDPTHVESGLCKARMSFHLREISSIPVKLGPWARFMNLKVLPGTSAQDIQAVIIGLQELSGRIKDLYQERGSLNDQYLISELSDEARKWRLVLKETLHQVSSVDEDFGLETVRDRLNDSMHELESRIRHVLNKLTPGQIKPVDEENFYRLLGAYRSVTNALIGHAANASAIDWTRWREERF